MHIEFWDRRSLEVELAGPGSPQRFVLSQPFALIGSDPTCDVILPDERLPQRCYLALLSMNGLVGTSLVRRSKSKFLRVNGDRGVRAGRFRIRFRVIESDPPSNEGADSASRRDASRAASLRWSIDGRGSPMRS